MKSLLHWVDYAIFGLTLAASLCIGIYHAFSGGRQKTTGEYIHGNRKIGLLPMTLSMMVTYISSLTMIGYPTEVVVFGGQYWIGSFGIILGVLLAVLLFVPIFYPLKITSVNEYLEMRYGTPVVKYLSTLFMVGGSMTFLGNIFYGPSAAIEAASGFPAWLSIVCCALVSVIYTCVGGFKAVIWTDVFQAVVMLAGLIVVSVTGLIKIGGFGEMWRVAGEWGRLNFFDFDPDPTKRMNFYGVVFGNALTMMGVYGHLQVGVQRYSVMPTLNKARLSVLGVLPGNLLIPALASMMGLVTFAYYAKLGCDPKQAGLIRSYNQIVPFFVADILNAPGVPGLFLAAITAATLSSASSLLNSMSAVLWADLLRPNFPVMAGGKNGARANKILVLLLGAVGLGLAILFDAFGGTMIQMMSVVVSSFAGPSEALFVIAAFVPWVSWQGMTAGSITGFAFGVWISLGSMLNSQSKTWQGALPVPDQCGIAAHVVSSLVVNATNSQALNNVLHATSPATSLLTPATSLIAAATDVQPSGLQKLYSLSFLWFKEASAGVTIVAAILFSIISGFRSSSTVPYNLVHPWIRSLVTLSPEAVIFNTKAEKTPEEKMAKDENVDEILLQSVTNI